MRKQAQSENFLTSLGAQSWGVSVSLAPSPSGIPKASPAIRPPSHNPPRPSGYPADLTEAPAPGSSVGLGFILAFSHQSPDLEFALPQTRFFPDASESPVHPLDVTLLQCMVMSP